MPSTYRHGQPTIGVLAGWQFAWTPTPLSYLDPIFRGAGLAAQNLGCNLLLGCGMGPWTGLSGSLRAAWPLVSSESDFVPIGPWNTAGLIAVNPLHSESRSRYMQELRATGHPLIFVAAGEQGPSVVADNRSGVLEAVRHLVEHGHRSVAFIAGSVEDIEGDTGGRLQAYHDAVEALGLDADPRLVGWGRHVYEGGYAAMRQILASGVPLTAVLASNDESALGGVQALREAGYRIPHDVAIIGFDDRPESAVQEPPLSSVRIPLRQMGYRAVESLYRYLTGQAGTVESARIETSLVARESCGCGPNALRPAAPTVAASRTEMPDRTASRGQLVRTMAALVLAEAQSLPSDEIEALCRCLVSAFDASVEREDPSRFQEALEAILRQGAASGDDLHIWQATLSRLGAALDGLPAATRGLGAEWLDWGRLTISANAQQQFRRNVVDQRWRLNRLGTLTARLLAALDEEHIYQVLAQHLPTMGIHTAWLALFGGEGGDPVAWTMLRDLTSSDPPLPRFPSRDFPPIDLLPIDQPFSLSVFPLTGPRGQLGYAVFDTADLDLYGAITQELATALNSAQLHREATEGRRLAEEANQMKSRFLSTVSHELRTPLNLIVGLSGVLLQESDESDLPLPEPYRSDVEQVYANAQHLGALIGDVLDLASSDAGQLRLVNEFVDLGQALGLVAETGRRLAFERGLAWQAHMPSSGPWVWGDRTRLLQVALNLINNAIKFTMRGRVSLTLESGPEAVTVSVHDTGLGIPSGEQQTVFDEFCRSERSVALGYGGLGLGLAISKRLIELHGGTIGVHSTGQKGAGSTFYFTLPTVQPPARSLAARPVASELGNQGVLVLTNRSGTGERLRDYLEQRGFQVQMALLDQPSDWQFSLLLSPPAVVVLDISVASDQAWNALKTIKANAATRGVPVLFYALSQVGGSVLELDYLTKPIELAELTRALDQQWLASGPGHSTRTILVVDDDPSTLEMHARIVQMQSSSNRVLKAHSGREALDFLRHEATDLVLLDLMMPEMDGFAVLEAMREHEAMRGIPVIVVTGQVLMESDMARLNRGVAKVLSKGLFGLEETLAHLSAALASRRELSAEAQRLVRQAMAYIHEHYADPISRQDLAKHVGLSDDYLTSCFHKEMGMTPVAYLNRYRIQKAKHLLDSTSKSITEIALEVGFSGSSYFSRIFLRETGMTPKAYRRK